ncbi:MAG: NAD-dependent epimerase/dehydratase family protein [Marinifilaceae bacterium]
MKNIAIIGGSGFVGTRLIDILRSNYSVKNFDKVIGPFNQDITTLLDIRDKQKVINSIHGFDTVILLAAEHRDDISPISLYYDVNVQGTKNVLDAMDKNGIKNIFFTSSVAVYGLDKDNPDEEHPSDPFNHYGKSKWEAEQVLRNWFESDPNNKVLNIIRPTVIFGERNRGNVYNLLSQIQSGRFLMIGNGDNCKSMAYIGNIVAVIKFSIENLVHGYQVFNYVDIPDFNMNQLVGHVKQILHKRNVTIRMPFYIGLLGGYLFDILAMVTNKKYKVSSVRVRKFCATTKFNANKIKQLGFIPPYTLEDGLSKTINYEFVDNTDNDNIVFITH